METGEVKNEKVQRSPSKHDWMIESGSEVAQRPDGQVVQQCKSSQLNQPNPNPDHERTSQTVVGCDPRTAQGGRKTSRSQEIETRSFHEEAVKPDRTETPVVGRDTNHEPRASQTRSSHESTNFNVGDETNHDRTGQPIVCRNTSHEPGNDQSMLNGVNTDFRTPGLPHSVVSCSRVREEDREPPSPTCSSTRSTTKRSLQPVQYDDKANDSGRGQRRAF